MQIIKPNMLKFHIHDKSIIIILTFLDLYKTLSWGISKECLKLALSLIPRSNKPKGPPF
jgi:hypothetical protein